MQIQPQHPAREWTVLAYLDGNNNITKSSLHHINDLESAAGKDSVTILAELGTLNKSEQTMTGLRYSRAKRTRTQGIPAENPPAAPKERPTATVNRYVVTPGVDEKKIESRLVENLGSRNMADPDCLADFLTWGIKEYPAKHYMIILKDHGMGMKGLLSDDTSGKSMTVPELDSALKKAQDAAGKPLDVVVLDMCKMAQAEALYQIKDRALYAIASQENQKVPGLPVGPMVTELTRENTDMEELMQTMIACARTTSTTRTFTTSAVRLPSMEGVRKAVEGLGTALMSHKDLYPQIREDMEKSQHFHSSNAKSFTLEVRDIHDLTGILLDDERISPPHIKEACMNLQEALAAAVVDSQFTAGPFTIGGEEVLLKDASGLSLYAPVSEGNDYEKQKCGSLNFVKDSPWAQFISELNSNPA